MGKLTLSPAELRILRLTAEGHREVEVAAAFGTSIWTIRAQRKAIKRKLGAITLSHAVAIGFRRGLLS